MELIWTHWKDVMWSLLKILLIREGQCKHWFLLSNHMVPNRVLYSSFPGLICRHVYYVRRILLWVVVSRVIIVVLLFLTPSLWEMDWTLMKWCVRCLIRVVSVLMVLSTTPTTSSFVMFVKKELIWLINSKLRSTNTKIITQINHPCQFPWIRLNHLIKIHIGRCFDHIKLFSYLILQPINHFTLHYKECFQKCFFWWYMILHSSQERSMFSLFSIFWLLFWMLQITYPSLCNL